MIKKSNHIYIILIIAMLSYINSYAQLTISPRGLTVGSYINLNDIGSVNITNSTPLLQNNLQITAALSNGNTNLYESTITGISIQSGASININTRSKENYQSANFKHTYDSMQIIPNGNYTICYIVINILDSVVIANYCFTLKVENMIGKKPPIKSFMNSTGFIQFAAFHAIGSDTLPKYLPNYYVWRGNPSIDIYDIPIRVDFQFNIINNQFDELTTYFNYSFDAARFQQNMKTKAIKTINSKLGDLNQYKAVSEKAKKELENVNRAINNLGAQKKLFLDKLKDSLKIVIDTKLKTYGDSLDNITGSHQNKLDSITKINPTDSIKNLYYTDSLRFEKPDSLINKLNTDTINTLADTLSNLISQYNKIGDYKVEIAKYKDLLKQKEQLEKMINYADSMKKNFDFKTIDELKENPTAGSITYSLLSNIKSLQYGTHVNTTSEFTCFAMPVNGFNFQTDNKGLILQYSNGTQIAFPTIQTNNYFYRKHILYGLGYGYKEKWNVRIVYKSSFDKDKRIELPKDSIDEFGPSINRVISLIGNIKLNKWAMLDAEFAGSETVNNTKFTSIVVDNPNLLNPFYNPTDFQSATNIINRKQMDYNRYVGYAFKASLNLKIDYTRTILTLTSKRTMPDFNTYGNLMLFKNMLGFDIKISQKIYRNNIKLIGLYKYSNFKTDTAGISNKIINQYGIDLSINFKNYPTLRLMYMPVQQQLTIGTILLNTLSGTSSYSYNLFKRMNIFTALILIQDAVGKKINSIDYYSKNINISNISIINKNLSITARYTNNVIITTGYSNNMNTVEMSGTYSFIKKPLSITPGIIYNFSTRDRKVGGSVELTYLINEIFSVNTRIEYNTYTNLINIPTNTYLTNPYLFPSYNECTGYISFNIKW